MKINIVSMLQKETVPFLQMVRDKVKSGQNPNV